ncbi:UNVERIFIED_CONTAM: hypothetical protein K2H54_042784 [Gekko kuhli]
MKIRNPILKKESQNFQLHLYRKLIILMLHLVSCHHSRNNSTDRPYLSVTLKLEHNWAHQFHKTLKPVESFKGGNEANILKNRDLSTKNYSCTWFFGKDANITLHGRF